MKTVAAHWEYHTVLRDTAARYKGWKIVVYRGNDRRRQGRVQENKGHPH
jgi:hypothetical protein